MEKSILGKSIKIFIDDQEYTLEQETLVGSELRNMAKLDASAELWQSIPGANNDKFVESSDIIKLQDGAMFISLKKTIGPSR